MDSDRKVLAALLDLTVRAEGPQAALLPGPLVQRSAADVARAAGVPPAAARAALGRLTVLCLTRAHRYPKLVCYSITPAGRATARHESGDVKG